LQSMFLDSCVLWIWMFTLRLVTNMVDMAQIVN
jgi:hypothetical protein